MIDLWAAHDEPPGRVEPPMPSSHLAPGGGGRGGNPILVVEDDPSILEMVVQILQDEGYPVVSATNGADGLAETNRTRPSLILLDMRMPRMDGWEFAAALRARGIAAPIVVMTAAENAKKWADEIGAEGYVSKPFHFPELLETVERHRRVPPPN